MRTRVKICGITRREDSQRAVDAGADAIGLVFYPKSPRFVNNTQAAEISLSIPAFVSTVALFKDADTSFVETVLQQVNIDLLQFHGSETVEFCEQFARPYIKALGMKSPDCGHAYLAESIQTYSSAKAILLDSHAPGEAGGTGEIFDWSSIGSVEMPVVLAGGLNPENVKQAIQIAHPYAVDVSSGVESTPGIKDEAKLVKFMRQVNQN